MNTLLLAAAVAAVTSPTPLHIFEAPVQMTNEVFGWSVLADRDHIFIGAPGDDTGGTNSGQAYAFDRRTYTLKQTYAATQIGGVAGRHLKTNGSQLLVGAFRGDVEGFDSAGRAHVFDIATGTLDFSIDNPAPDDDARFGSWAAWVGDGWLVGGYKSDLVTTTGGAAWRFDVDGTLVDTLTDPTPAVGDRFGYSVEALGNWSVVNAYRDSELVGNGGASFIFDENGVLQRKILNPQPANGDLFGAAVAGAGHYLLIGAFEDDGEVADTGSAFLYDALTGHQLLRLDNPSPHSNDGFGFKVAFVGDNLLVSAFRDDTDAGFDAGVAYLFDGVTGTLLETFDDPIPKFGNLFGFSVAAAGTDILIGSTGADDIGHQTGDPDYLYNVGRAYLFSGDAYLPAVGDANHDGYVGGVDYLAWAANFTPGDAEPLDPHHLVRGPVDGDFNYDGLVDGLDYHAWASNYLQGPNDGVAVPEPGALGLALLAVVGGLSFPRRRST